MGVVDGPAVDEAGAEARIWGVVRLLDGSS